MRTFNYVMSYINLRDTQETDWRTISPDGCFNNQHTRRLTP